MALSNWDTLALTHDGKPSDGSFVSPLGVHVSFYKNWIYVHDAQAWRDGGKYQSPVVMEVHQGEVTYKDVEITAFRGPQSGIYAVVSSGAEYDKTLQGMIGCGVYGFSEETEEKESEWTGVLPESVEWFRAKLLEVDLEPDEEWIHDYPADGPMIRRKVVRPPDPNDPTYVHFVPKVFRQMNWNQGQRFNQGDQYLAERTDTETPVSKLGEAQEPFMLQWIKRSRG